MPFRSFADLLQLIEQKMPRRVRDALAKGDARLKWFRDMMQCDRPDMLALVNADSIVQAMKDVRCRTDADELRRDKMMPGCHGSGSAINALILHD